MVEGVLSSAVETSIARGLTGSRQRFLAEAVSLNTALPLRASRGETVLAVADSGHVRPLARTKVRAIGAATEASETRRLISEVRAGLVHDQSQARSLTRIKARSIGAAAETGAAAAAHLGRGLPLRLATTSETAASLGWTKIQVIGPVVDRSVVGVFAPWLPPLRVGLPYRSWGAHTPELLRGVVVDPISSLSLEYMRVFVKHARGTEPVEIAFTTPGVEPGPADWKTASWAEAKDKGAVAQILVGPGGTVTLTDGTYQVWVRTVRADERPVLPSGLVPII
jgi:hypothetical protein